LRSRRLVVQQNPRGIAFVVIILVRPDRPQKRDQPDSAQNQRYRNQDYQYIHHIHLIRWAFSKTVIDEIDMDSAAASGVQNPMIANGTEIRL